LKRFYERNSFFYSFEFKAGGETIVYRAEKPLLIEVSIGEIMQWEADKESDLHVFEVCYPPYEDGRYENLPLPVEKFIKIKSI